MVELTKLVNEMKTLRKGRGLYVSQIGARVGAALREVCEITDTDGPSEIRQKVGRRLEILSAGLPEDLRFAVQAAFAIRPDVRLPLYKDRVGWAAARLNRDPRTARRRVDDGIYQLAQLATITPPKASVPVSLMTSGPACDWHTSELRITVALDRDRPEVLEQRRIVAVRDDLSELDLAVTVAEPPRPRLRDELDISVFYGGTLIEGGMESSERLAFQLALPRPLEKDEEHEFALHFSFPPGYVMQPHFACVPKNPCALFDLRVRFDPARLPRRIWSLRSVFQRDAGDPNFGGEPVTPDQAGEIHLTFERLSPGLAYGASWVL
jgi:hypothetical protein